VGPVPATATPLAPSGGAVTPSPQNALKSRRVAPKPLMCRWSDARGVNPPSERLMGSKTRTRVLAPRCHRIRVPGKRESARKARSGAVTTRLPIILPLPKDAPTAGYPYCESPVLGLSPEPASESPAPSATPPAPSVEASCSSLTFASPFCRLLRQLEQWLPVGLVHPECEPLQLHEASSVLRRTVCDQFLHPRPLGRREVCG